MNSTLGSVVPLAMFIKLFCNSLSDIQHIVETEPDKKNQPPTPAAMHVQPSCCSKSVPIATDSVRNPHEILKLIRIQNNQPPNPWVGFFHRI